MKTCKDCIHQEVCLEFVKIRTETLSSIQQSEYCLLFRDKTKFIEKPFNIRDRIYIITKYIHSGPYEIINCMVTKMRFKNDGAITFSCEGHYANNNRYISGNFKTSSIGKTVFLTREEAQKKLEEMNNEKE